MNPKRSNCAIRAAGLIVFVLFVLVKPPNSLKKCAKLARLYFLQDSCFLFLAVLAQQDLVTAEFSFFLANYMLYLVQNFPLVVV